MTTLLFVAAIAAALIAIGVRRGRQRRLRRAAMEQPGATLETAIYIRDFREMDDHVAHRWCWCGGMLEPTGEGTRESGERRFRVARLRCLECEESQEIFFETTELLQ